MSYGFKIVDGDIVRNHSNTGYARVTGIDKLKQNCKMTITTDIRADGVGCGLDKIIGKHVDGEPELAYGTPMMFLFQGRVRDGLSRLRYAQKNYLFSRRTPDEMLSDFSPVQVWALEDPRNFRWQVEFFTWGNKNNFALGGTTR